MVEGRAEQLASNVRELSSDLKTDLQPSQLARTAGKRRTEQHRKRDDNAEEFLGFFPEVAVLLLFSLPPSSSLLHTSFVVMPNILHERDRCFPNLNRNTTFDELRSALGAVGTFLGSLMMTPEWLTHSPLRGHADLQRLFRSASVTAHILSISEAKAWEFFTDESSPLVRLFKQDSFREFRASRRSKLFELRAH